MLPSVHVSRSSGDAEEATGDRRPEGDRRPAGAPRGKLLLLCFLQGLKAGASGGTDARHQVAMQLLHSEWEYVSALNQLCDKYRTPPAHQMTVEPYQTSVKFVEQLLQRHLLFRNSLQERLTAELWKSLVGDVVVQLTGHNDTAFSDMYLGYTATLASFLSREFDGLNRSEKMQNMQSVQAEREEVKLLHLLLAPISRIHGYLSHIQNLLQWTGTEHPDRSLLLGSERVLRSVLTHCHVILEEDVRWEEGGGGGGQSSCADAVAGGASAKCCTRSQQANAAAQRDDQQPVSNGVDGCHSMRLECWSCSPVRRRKEVCGRDRTLQNQPARDRGHACCSLLTPDAAAWGEHSDSGQGSNSQLTGKGTDGPEAPRARHGLEDCETDQDDTSAFDYSSVTSGSPDATLRRETTGSNSGEEEEEEEEEEDSQVPVLLKPSYSQQQPPQPRERTVCLRWQIPRMTPHPPLRSAADGPSHVGAYGKRLVTVRKGPGPAQQRGPHAAAGLWEDSEDSEGPCSTV
ncbi:Rho guanine nucleotide exchange factor 33 [Liparis tanakae]|uniref:Rho guanine nucleotide exchange factor 33 n=1 Tax=Liparis tanakae TaxID=230148 RepID=A0A4Z2HKY2_9TELE|nr:Rho guanine nucleotide exchange factor 33 [Liparis tanakae]